MNKLFFVILCLLCVASGITVMTKHNRQTERPVIYWKSDTNPQRYEQIELFHQWLVKNGHVDKNGKPIVELRLDAANNQSKLIQAVSGVGGDIIDSNVSEFYPLGVICDITDGSKAGRYSLDNTYPGLRRDLSVDGKQYGYPCNGNVMGLWVNDDTFAKYGMKAPPEIWTPEQFEKIGKEFVTRGNKDLIRRRVFFCSGNQLNFIIPMYSALIPVSYTHLTLPTILLVQISVVAVSLKKKKNEDNTCILTVDVKTSVHQLSYQVM
eukprot:TRINITY_DN19134_c0_g2_i1.p2 TRINITY_DN19134_c0_g2~~TRINITY_DN19134_c0_g2_i1.p2  ORF type:complete len:265 (-),score=41.39 TRINITY_DN19134_c0_g2_i1:36-830(-)